MSRCDYDVVFYRVFCVTLLAVAFTFTVILTNVFVDIDGLLSNKKKYTQVSTQVPEAFVNYADIPVEDRKEEISNEYKNYDIEIKPRYRTKRSIDPESTLRAKSPAMKKMLTRRLASLLEELDEEEEHKEGKVEMTTIKEVPKVTEKDEDRTEGIKNEDLIHLAMHNILLQGLIGHMDLNDVYKKVHVLVDTFNKRINNNKYAHDTKLKILESVVNSKEKILKDIAQGTKRYNNNEENQFLGEMMKCKKLEEQVARTTLSNEINTSNKNKIGKDDKVFVKTVIEINEINSSKGPSRTLPIENIEGLVKLIYNGKLIKVNQLLDETKLQNFSKNNTNHEIEQVTSRVAIKDNNEIQITELNQNNRENTQSTFLNQVLEEYLKKHSRPKYESKSAELEKIKTQRLKRQIKIRYSDNNNNTKTKTKPLHGGVNKNEDDLYIEIETHFDGKGIKGEKKKKLVRNLIDKIQKALNSDIEKKRDSEEHIKFLKRTQDPIYSQNKISLIKKIAPLEPIEHRQLDPIGKTLETHENIVDGAGDAWKKKFEGPNFLSLSKSVNSAEMNELTVDYESVLKNGISKRLQQPLNTESIKNDEDDSEAFLDPYPGNVNLFLKDIDGSGFSIGFNQYAGEPPDRESLKMFDGIENLIREYHKRYDEADNISSEPVNFRDSNLFKMDDKIANNNRVDSHKVSKRSITKVGGDYYNANIYKTILKEDPSFRRYYLNIFKHANHISEITNNENMKSDEKDGVYSFNMKSSLKAVPIVVDERIMGKKLKPSEILTIANLIQRKRRSINVKKISNLKSKIKLNRYLNTKTVANKKVFFNRKRNKRQVINIKAARERPQVPEKSSDENIFFISRENLFSDKDTSIRAVEMADTKKTMKRTEYIDEESPFDNIYRIQNPNDRTALTENLYSAAQRSKGLMSKYPHMFLDKSSNSKEMYFDETQYNVNKQPYRIQASPKSGIINQEMKTTTEQYYASVLQDLVSKELVGAIMPSPSRPKFKITVKILPKNKTSSNGFKEVHTSVNKSFEENGLRYYTLLNVSQISKIEKLNITDSKLDVEQPISDHLFDQQKQIKNLLKLHKKRVDLQLNGLLRESDHLEQMIESSKKYSIDKPITLLDIYKDRDTENVEKTLDFVRMRQDNYSTESNFLKTTHTNSGTLTHSSPVTEASKTDKSIIFDTIKQNENITLEILKKIDTNTRMMQTLLQKISDRIDLDKEEHTTIESKTNKKAGVEVKLDLSKNWKANGANQNPFFIPNEFKNDTVPFVYAYQQSIPLQSKTPQSLASVVYHGHIHTNPVQTVNNPAPKVESKVIINTDNSRKKINESKFFLDEVDNFQVTPDNNVRVISANIKINTTNVT